MPESLYLVEEIAAFETRDLWTALWQKHGLRPRPPRTTRPTPVLMRRWLKLIGISREEFCDWAGVGQVAEWIMRNPRWPLYGLIGLMLECREWLDAERAQKATGQG